MNIIDYTYYKIYKGLERSSLWNIAGFGAGMYLGGLIAINIIEILVLAAKQDFIRFPTTNKYIVGAFCGIFGFLFSFLYSGNRRNKVLEKFSHENEQQKLIGNIIVWGYIALSCFMIIIVGLYKPGYLGNK